MDGKIVKNTHQTRIITKKWGRQKCQNLHFTFTILFQSVQVSEEICPETKAISNQQISAAAVPRLQWVRSHFQGNDQSLSFQI